MYTVSNILAKSATPNALKVLFNKLIFGNEELLSGYGKWKSIQPIHTHACMQVRFWFPHHHHHHRFCVGVCMSVCTTRVGIMQFNSILQSTHMPYAFARSTLTHMHVHNIVSESLWQMNGLCMCICIISLSIIMYAHTITRTHIVHISAVSKKFHRCENVLQFQWKIKQYEALGELCVHCPHVRVFMYTPPANPHSSWSALA